MKKYRLLWVILIFCSGNFLKSDVIPIDSIEQAQDTLMQAPPGACAVFDMDGMLIDPAEKMFYPVFRFNHMDDFDESSIAFALKVNKFFATKGNRAIFAKIKFVPVEPDIKPTIVELIKTLQYCDIKIIALTATGKQTGDLAVYSKWRLANLEQIGLNFEHSFEKQEIILDALPPIFESSPLFYKGILFSAGYLKGKVLSAFLNKINWKPNKILFFDDSLEQCKSVSIEMEKKNISCHCFWYLASHKNKIKLNQKLIETQLDYWTEHKEILPEAEALKLISNP